jgi:trk system potassium uptake protein TrkA
VIIGAGEVGYSIGKRLSEENNDVIMVEYNERRLRFVRDTLDVEIIHGNGSSPEVLKEAGIEKADILVAVTNSDETNMVACLIASAYSLNTIKIARIRNQEYLKDPSFLSTDSLRIDRYINPEAMAAERIIRTLEIPVATDVIEFENGRINLVGLKVSREAWIAGKRLYQLKEKYPFQRILFAAKLKGTTINVPKGDELIAPDDILYAVVEPSFIPQIAEIMGHVWQPIHRVMITGGTNTGLYLAQRLEKKGFSVKFIEEDERRASYLSEQLQKTVVLIGESTSPELLVEENITSCDAFIALSEKEEVNILAALGAKKMGARKAITLTHKASYIPLIIGLGVDVVISPRSLAISSILHYIRRGRILQVTALEAEDAEAIEFEVLPNSPMAGRLLKDIGFPKHAIIGALLRGKEIIIPKGNDKIMAHDKLIVFTLRQALPKIEQLMKG